MRAATLIQVSERIERQVYRPAFVLILQEMRKALKEGRKDDVFSICNDIVEESAKLVTDLHQPGKTQGPEFFEAADVLKRVFQSISLVLIEVGYAVDAEPANTFERVSRLVRDEDAKITNRGAKLIRLADFKKNGN